MAYHDGVKPIAEMKNWCQLTEDGSRDAAKTSGAGEMVLPGANRESPLINPSVMLDSDQTHIERLWIFVCVAYQDPWKSKTHYSRYMFLTQHRDLGTGPSIQPDPVHPVWTYIPITAAHLVSAQAE